MTIDISQLSPEKRAFLKANPELLKGLEQEIPKQVAGIQKRKEKLEKGKVKWQRDLEDANRRVEDAKQRAEELRREYDPELMKINRRFMGKAVRIGGALVCPVCGDSDHGNKVNGKAWCIKCNSPLIPESKLTAWKKLPKIKALPKGLKDELRRLNPGLFGEDEK